MEGFKKNLHLVALAAGVIVGAVLLGVGLMVKSGAQQRLAEELSRLPKAAGDAAPPTQGDLLAIQSARSAFNDQLAEADRVLRTKNGAALRADMASYTDGITYSSREGTAHLALLRSRFEALERPQKVPPIVGPRFVSQQTTLAPVWPRLTQELQAASDGPRILAMQIQLRILDEVCAIGEALQQRGGFADDGIQLLDIKVDARSTDGATADKPWDEWPFTLVLRCRPALATAIVSELASPTAITAGKARRNFPVEILGVQQEMAPRPHYAIAEITNEDKPTYGIPVDAPVDSDVVRKRAQEIADELAKDSKVRFQTGLNVGIRANALSLNRNWRALADEQPAQ